MKRYLPVCLLLISFSAYGALTKWVDAEGKVHYSDEPPPDNVKKKALSVPHDPAGTPQKTFVEREAELKKAQKAEGEAALKAAKQQEEALAKQKNCTGAKANLKILESSAPLATYDDKGERSLMDDATRKQNIEEARKQISTFCN